MHFCLFAYIFWNDVTCVVTFEKMEQLTIFFPLIQWVPSHSTFSALIILMMYSLDLNIIRYTLDRFIWYGWLLCKFCSKTKITFKTVGEVSLSNSPGIQTFIFQFADSSVADNFCKHCGWRRNCSKQAIISPKHHPLIGTCQF